MSDEAQWTMEPLYKKEAADLDRLNRGKAATKHDATVNAGTAVEEWRRRSRIKSVGRERRRKGRTRKINEIQHIVLRPREAKKK